MGGNRWFRLSDMMPNAWFHKLKDMTRTHTTTTNNYDDNKKKKIGSTTTMMSKKQQSPPPSSSTTPQQAHAHQVHLYSHETTTTTTTTTFKQKLPHLITSSPRKSYYSRQLHSSSPPINPKSTFFYLDPPRKSSKHRPSFSRRSRTPSFRYHSSPKLVSSPVSSGCNCRPAPPSPPLPSSYKSDSPPLRHEGSPSDHTCSLHPLGDLHVSESLIPSEYTGHSEHAVLATESSFDNMNVVSACSRLADQKSICEEDSCKPEQNFGSHDIVINFDPKALPPIVTNKTEKSKCSKSSNEVSKTSKRHGKSVLDNIVKEEKTMTPKQNKTINAAKRNSASSPGVRLRVNSPRIGSGRFNYHQVNNARKSVSCTSTCKTTNSSNKTNITRASSSTCATSGMAVVKASADPQRDFRESMVEMIVENNIRGSKQLEELLACYLELNSDEYHDLIINVFKQIWFDLMSSK